MVRLPFDPTFPHGSVGEAKATDGVHQEADADPSAVDQSHWQFRSGYGQGDPGQARARSDVYEGSCAPENFGWEQAVQYVLTNYRFGIVGSDKAEALVPLPKYR